MSTARRTRVLRDGAERGLGSQPASGCGIPRAPRSPRLRDPELGLVLSGLCLPILILLLDLGF